MAPPTAPTAPPMPTTVETAVEGNMSVGVEKRLADQPWWAAAASAMTSVAGQALVGKRCAHVRERRRWAATQSAQRSRANLRPELTEWPRFMRQPESHPPAMEPTRGDDVDGDDLPFGVVEVEAVVLVEELGEIEEIEPPDGVGEALGDGEGVEAAAAAGCRVGQSAAAGGLGAKSAARLAWVWVDAAAEPVVGEEQPDDEPDQAHGAGGEEGGLPAPLGGDEGDERGGDEEAERWSRS